MIEETLDIQTRDGPMETFICRPERGIHPTVFMLMDAPGIRDELRDGRSLQSAVETGWNRAKRTILAADSVNFLAALVLAAGPFMAARHIG